MSSTKSVPQVDAQDDVDLIGVLYLLWTQKWIVVTCTLVVTAASVLYAWLTPPIYEAKAGVLPPRLSDISGYNLGRTEAKLAQFSISDVYEVFTRNLLSGTIKRKLFNEVYMPSLSAEMVGEAKDVLWKEFNEDLVIKVPDIKNSPNYYVVTVEHQNPELAAKWANKFVGMVAAKTADDMHDNLLTEVGTKIQSLERQISALRATARAKREDEIAQLKEALVVAESVGLEDPQVVIGKTASTEDITSFTDGSLKYMRGAKAMRAELSVLEERKNDDPFIATLRDLENELIFLRDIDVDPNDVSSYTLDSEALLPETPVRPVKVVVIVLGFLFGGVIGIGVALLYGRREKYKLERY